MNTLTDWAGRGFSGFRAQQIVDAAEIGYQALTRRVQRIKVPRLPLWGAAQPHSVLILWPGEADAVVHFYGRNGSYLQTMVMRSGGVLPVPGDARYWRAEAIPATFDEVLAAIR